MATSFNPIPTPAEISTLAQIAANESTNNPMAMGPMTSSGQATGLYQITDGTWAWISSITGIGTQYSQAAQAPVSDQTSNALWLLQNYGPNATISWAASGPYVNPEITSPTTPIASVNGNIPTSDLLSQADMSIANLGTGIDPNVLIALLLAGAAVAIIFTRS